MPNFRLSDDQLSEVKEGFPPAYTRHVGEQAWMHLYREAMA